MLQNLSISKKIHIPLISSILVGLFVIMINYFYSIQDMEDNIYKTDLIKKTGGLKTRFF